MLGSVILVNWNKSLSVSWASWHTHAHIHKHLNWYFYCICSIRKSLDFTNLGQDSTQTASTRLVRVRRRLHSADYIQHYWSWNTWGIFGTTQKRKRFVNKHVSHILANCDSSYHVHSVGYNAYVQAWNTSLPSSPYYKTNRNRLAR